MAGAATGPPSDPGINITSRRRGPLVSHETVQENAMMGDDGEKQRVSGADCECDCTVTNHL